MAAETPLMKQYNSIKAKHPDALLLFRVGDFYETFGQDAIRASDILGIVLTKRKNGSASSVELAGFPHHALDTYLPKLVRAGQRVAICDQLEDPKLTMKIVKRGITELVTPGVALNDQILEAGENNYLCALHFGKKEMGISFLDISTGEFLISEGSELECQKLISSLAPKEILLLRNRRTQFEANFQTTASLFPLEDWVFQESFAQEILQDQLKVNSLKGFGIDQLKSGIVAAGSIVHYLRETRHGDTKHITGLKRFDQSEFLWLDQFTIRNLELFHSNSYGGTSLLDVIDRSKSSMGSRCLKRWVAFPLKERSAIEGRLTKTDFFLKNDAVHEALSEAMSGMSDLERMASKIAFARVRPKELQSLAHSLDLVGEVISSLKGSKKVFGPELKRLDPCSTLLKRLSECLSEEPPVAVAKGGVFVEGFSKELDELRNLSRSGKDHLVQIQTRESERTGIPSLKIGFNNVFGYYLEVTNTHKDKVPEEWDRRQTLVNSERYITQELKEFEEKILGAEDKILALETKLYEELVVFCQGFLEKLQTNALCLGELDCLLGFAELAQSNEYVKPELNESGEINIIAGRHPVIEKCLPDGEDYIPNDLFIDREQQQILMITGPNMSGKSALLRQSALIVLLAQIGSFVPAQAARIGVVDRIFTRVGASDNLSQGESTFMVEMNETASILNNLSDNSLILLDEIGRGTSTYDGISIAWSIAEYLHQSKHKPKCLFATHYHELNDMADSFERIKNFHVSIKEHKGEILFLRKLLEGGSEHSFGIHVAKLAGMPHRIIERADRLLTELERSHQGTEKRAKNGEVKDEFQLSFFQLDDPTLSQIKEEILKTDIDTLTPVEALLKLNEIKKMVGKG
jgi:DNA mismatch repair protein MutS